MDFMKRNALTIVVAMTTAIVTAGAPVIAHGVHARFAHRAGKVDGKDAVGAGVSKAKAAGKLVSTGDDGKFNPRFIPKVNNADHLDEMDSSAFQKTCQQGAVRGFAWVINPQGNYDMAAVPNVWTPIFKNSAYNCSGGEIYLRRQGVGHYWISFEDNGGRVASVSSDASYGKDDLYAVVGFPLNSNDSNTMAKPGHQIKLYNAAGALVDSPFFIVTY